MSDEPMRARYPDEEGYVERDGVRIFWERYGEGAPTLYLLPAWALTHSRMWKGQIAYLARHFRVLVSDPRGNGRSDRPTDPAAYAEREQAQDALDVMDATGTERAILVGEGLGVQRALILAAEHPDRVAAVACFTPYLPLHTWLPEALMGRAFDHAGVMRPVAAGIGQWLLALGRRPRAAFNRGLWRLLLRTGVSSVTAWNRPRWQHDWHGAMEWVARHSAPDVHSTKLVEDLHDYMTASGPEQVAAHWRAERIRDPREARALCHRVRCPVLVMAGARGLFEPVEDAKALARETGGRLLILDDWAAPPFARRPVESNLELRALAESCRTREPVLAHEGGAHA